MNKTIKVSTTMKKHFAKSEASRYALCGAEVYRFNPGDERITTGLCKTCEKLSQTTKETK